MSCVCRSFCCCYASCRRTKKNLQTYVPLKEYQKVKSEGVSGEFHNVPVEKIFHTSQARKGFSHKHALHKHAEYYPHEENVQMASFLLTSDTCTPSKYGSTSQPVSRKAAAQGGRRERQWSTSSTESDVGDNKFLMESLENPQKVHYRSRSPSPHLSADEDSHFTSMPQRSKMSHSPSLDLAQFQRPRRSSSRPSSALGLSAGSGASSDEQEDTPTLQFSLYYDIQRRTLTVHLQKAYNLPVKGVDMRACNSFVVLFLLPSREEILQTPVVEKDLNPVFDQVFEFRGILSQELYQQVLVLQVFDHDRFLSDDLIGTVLIPMKEAELYGMTMKRKIGEGKEILKQYSNGDLHLSLRYSTNQEQIQGVVLKASNLPRQHHFGLADPYVKLYLVHKGKRQSKWKTTIKKNTLLPVFNEPFQFDVKDMDLKNLHLEILVMDHDRFRRNDIMGVVYIGPNSPQECGRSHWSEMMVSVNSSVSRWHPLLPRHEARTVHKHLDTRMLKRMKSRSL